MPLTYFKKTLITAFFITLLSIIPSVSAISETSPYSGMMNTFESTSAAGLGLIAIVIFLLFVGVVFSAMKMLK